MPDDLATHYRGYIACLNAQAWARLAAFVHPEVDYNGQRVGLSGYQAMLERDHALIPDLQFHIDLLTVQPPWVAARLLFDCSPQGEFLGLATHGKRLQFSENVFYRFEGGKVREVHSVIDKAAVERQL